MSKLRVATIGTGYFSRFHYDGWTRMDDVELVGVCNRTLAQAQAFAGEFNIPEAFDDVATMLDTVEPELVDIITPPVTHASVIAELARRGINGICQKPFCTDLATAKAAAKAAGDGRIVLAVHENFRFQPWYEVIADELARGRLGEIYQATFRLRPGDGQGPQAYLDRQPYFQQMPRFLVHETAIHLIDVFRYLFGEATSVYADLARLNPAIAGEDAGLIVMHHANAVRCVFDGNRLADHSAQNRRLTMGEMLVEGSAGTLRLDGDANIALRAHGTNDWQDIAYTWRDTGFGGDCVYRCNAHVVAHLLHGAPLMNSAQDYLQNLRIEDAVYRSAEQGLKLQLDAD